MDELIFISGRQKGRHVPLQHRRLNIGRERNNDIPVEDEAASRLHAYIEYRDGNYWLNDNAATNGTYLNDRRIDRDKLTAGDRIGIGDTTLIVKLAAERRQSPTVVFDDLMPDDVAMNVRLDTSSSRFLAVDPRVLDDVTQQSFVQLYEFTTEVSSTLQSERVLDILLEHIFKAIQADRAFVLLLDEDGNLLPRRSRVRKETADNADVSDEEVKLPRTMLSYVLKTGEALLTMDASSDARFADSQSVSRLRINSVMVAPLKVKDKMLGLVYMDTIQHAAPFTEVDLKLVTAMSIQCAVCLENARLYEELMDSLEYSAAVLRSLSSGIIVVDTSGIITRLNDAAQEILNMDERDLIGRSIREFDQFRELAKLLATTLRSGSRHDRREIVISVGEEQVPIGIGTSTLVDHAGNVVGVIANFRNIANIKRMAEQVKQNRYLASLGEMSAGVAHEIRNPLNSIHGFAQLLLERVDQPESREFCNIILEEVVRMNKIVQDLLDFSRSRQLTMVNMDIDAFVRGIASEMQAELEKASVVLEIVAEPNLPRVMGNVDKLHQVFVNIITNAIQAMPQGGKITIRIDTPDASDKSEGEPKMLRISITDTGIGIESSILKRIYDPFFTTRDIGTGLGLSICMRIIEQHGGTITTESEAGKGSTFFITLPISKAPVSKTFLQ